MKKIYFILSILLTTLSWQQGKAQEATLIRQVLCAWGTNHALIKPDSSVQVASTMGQCPGCTVIKSNSGELSLRQGFQQPPIKSTRVPGVKPCNSSIAFDYTEKKTVCGSYYDFEYTGNEQAGLKYLWTFGSDASPQTSAEKNPSKVAFSTIGRKKVILRVYKLLANGNLDCADETSRSFDVNSTGFAALASTNSACGGSNGTITLSPSGGTAPYTYKWTTGETTPNIANLAAGDYTYTITDSKGCVFSATETVNGSDQPLAVMGTVINETTKGAADGSIALIVSGGSGNSNYAFKWKNTNSTTAAASNLSAGKYPVTVTDINYGCSTSKVFTVLDLSDPNIVDSLKSLIPNTFSPNGDGINDGWESTIFEQFPNLEVQIFNRWGSLVFDKKGFGSGNFVGNNGKGEELPSAAYFYIMNFNDAKKLKIGGSVTIVR